MSQEHYFSSDPETEFRPREIQVELAGRSFAVTTAGGVFSPDHIDSGTAVLLAHLDEVPPGGNLLDIGCGWGPIALALALASPASTVWAIDVNQRSLDLTKMNAKRLGLTNIKTARPEEVPTDIEFTGIWSNPPIRVGKAVLHDLMQTWMPRLTIGGESLLVVQKNLGADSLQRWLEGQLGSGFKISRVDSSKGFRVLSVKKN